jgi:hypothetical protein
MNCPCSTEVIRKDIKESMRKVLYSAVLALVCFAPMAHGQAKPLVLSPRPLVVSMPEVATPAILATDLISVGALIFVFRRRRAARTNQ